MLRPLLRPTRVPPTVVARWRIQSRLLPAYVFERSRMFNAKSCSFHQSWPLDNAVVRSNSSLQAGEGNTGHIADGPSKALFYFDSLFIIRKEFVQALNRDSRLSPSPHMAVQPTMAERQCSSRPSRQDQEHDRCPHRPSEHIPRDKDRSKCQRGDTTDERRRSICQVYSSK